MKMLFNTEFEKNIHRDIYADLKMELIAKYLEHTKCPDRRNNSQILKIIYKRRKVNKKHKLKKRKNKNNSRRKRRKN